MKLKKKKNVNFRKVSEQGQIGNWPRLKTIIQFS